MKRIFWCVAGVVLVLVTGATAAQFHVGLGASFAEDPKQGIAEAFDEAFKMLGDKKAKLAIVTENYTGGRNGRALAPLIIEKARGVPVYGAGLGGGDYTAQSPAKGFFKKRSISVLLLGGDFEFQAETVKMGPVRYANNADRRNNPEKYAADVQTMVDNRQKPGLELAKRLKFGDDQNLLLIFGQLHNPEITYFTKGLAEVVGDKVTVIGVASQNGGIYVKDKFVRSSGLGLLIKGKFQTAQAMAGQYWDGKDLDKHFARLLKQTTEKVQKPDLVIGILCGSWHRGPIADQHKALVDTLSKAAPYFGTYGGGELGRMADRRGNVALTGTGGCGVVTVIKSQPQAASQEDRKQP